MTIDHLGGPTDRVKLANMVGLALEPNEQPFWSQTSDGVWKLWARFGSEVWFVDLDADTGIIPDHLVEDLVGIDDADDALRRVTEDLLSADHWPTDDGCGCWCA